MQPCIAGIMKAMFKKALFSFLLLLFFALNGPHSWKKREKKFFRGVIFMIPGGNRNKLKVFANNRMLKTNGLTIQ